MQSSPLDCSIDWIWSIEKGPPLFPVGKIIEMTERAGDIKRESSWGTIWEGSFLKDPVTRKVSVASHGQDPHAQPHAQTIAGLHSGDGGFEQIAWTQLGQEL